VIFNESAIWSATKRLSLSVLPTPLYGRERLSNPQRQHGPMTCQSVVSSIEIIRLQNILRRMSPFQFFEQPVAAEIPEAFQCIHHRGFSQGLGV
jgi:hypothetical protein